MSILGRIFGSKSAPAPIAQVASVASIVSEYAGYPEILYDKASNRNVVADGLTLVCKECHATYQLFPVSELRDAINFCTTHAHEFALETYDAPVSY